MAGCSSHSSKNRNRKPIRLALPIVPELRPIIDASPTGDLAFLVSDRGTPYTPESFGLCKAAGGRLAELGASVHQIAAALGHRTLKAVLRHTASAEQRVMAARALARWSNASGNVFRYAAGPDEWD